MLRVGMQVVLLGTKGKGNVIRVEGDSVEVRWQRGVKRERFEFPRVSAIDAAGK